MVREVKESLLPWLSGQALPARPVLADYGALARRWVNEVLAARRHRTTGRLIGDAWCEERATLTAIRHRYWPPRSAPMRPSRARPTHR
jgi:hypothetical protein